MNDPPFFTFSLPVSGPFCKRVQATVNEAHWRNYNTEVVQKSIHYSLPLTKRAEVLTSD
jgi:hypothetical protein